MEDCVLCTRLTSLAALAPGEVVWQFPESVALLGTWQYYDGYCVLVCRTHVTELSALADSVRQTYLDEMCILARAIEAYARPRKLNYELLGNQVPHLHWHLFPRSADDPDVLKAVWLALDRAERDAELRRRYEASRRSRAAITADLQRHLHSLGAPTP